MLFKIYRYLSHWLHSYDRHSLQGPFIYNFYEQCFRRPSPQKSIEELRTKLKKNQTEIGTKDLGARSKVTTLDKRKISSIASKGITSAQNSALLKSIIEYFKLQYILELGTSLGLNTAYLANPASVQKVYSFEGDHQIVNFARKNLSSLNLIDKVELIVGDIDSTLPDFIDNSDEGIDFAFIDANHTKSATLNYFNLIKPKLNQNGIIVFDDINWSKEMRKAWDSIRTDKSFPLSIETYQFGIMLMTTELTREHWVLSFN